MQRQLSQQGLRGQAPGLMVGDKHIRPDCFLVKVIRGNSDRNKNVKSTGAPHHGATKLCFSPAPKAADRRRVLGLNVLNPNRQTGSGITQRTSTRRVRLLAVISQISRLRLEDRTSSRHKGKQVDLIDAYLTLLHQQTTDAMKANCLSFAACKSCAELKPRN